MVLEWIPPQSIYFRVPTWSKRSRLVFCGRTGLKVPVSFLESFDGPCAAGYASSKYLVGVRTSDPDS